jgi:hypothetical protein
MQAEKAGNRLKNKVVSIAANIASYIADSLVLIAMLPCAILLASLEGYMTRILEELQSRVADSKVRLDAATKTFQSAQTAFQQAQQDHSIWTSAWQAEVREVQRQAAIAIEKQLPLPTAQSTPNSEPEIEDFVDDVIDAIEDSSGSTNKTDTVRDLLRRHPAGMSAVDIWAEVRSDFKHRPYLYSVLKRLRDREEIIKRRGKYCLKLIPKAEEAQEHSAVH